MTYYPAFMKISFLIILISIISTGLTQNSSEIQLAENLLRARNYEAALRLFKRNYDKGDLSDRVIRGMTSCFTEMGQNKDLIIYLKEVTKKVPDIFSYSIDLSEICKSRKILVTQRDSLENCI